MVRTEGEGHAKAWRGGDEGGREDELQKESIFGCMLEQQSAR